MSSDAESGVDATGLPVEISEHSSSGRADTASEILDPLNLNEDARGKRSPEELNEMRDNALDSDEEVPVSPDGLQLDPEANMEGVQNPHRTRRMQTLMNIVNSVLGAGILGISNSMKGCGVVVAIILILIVSIMTCFGTILTIRLQYRTKAGTFDELAEMVLGKYGAVALSISEILFCYSCMVAYLVVARDNIASWFEAGGIDYSGRWPSAVIVLVNSLLVPIPLTIPRSLAFLSYFSMATVLSVFYFFFAILIKACMILPKKGLGPNIVWADGGMSLFSAISVYCLAFCLPAVIIPLVSPYNPDVHKRGVVTTWSMALCTVLILVPGVLGYLCFGSDTKDNILNTFSSKDYFILTVKIAFYLVVSFSYPCIGQSVMSAWGQIIFKSNNQADLPNGKRAVVLVITNLIALVIAMFLPNITPALSVGGALGGALCSFFFPPLMWVCLSKRPLSAPRNVLMILYTIFGFAISCICIVQSIFDAIKAFK